MTKKQHPDITVAKITTTGVIIAAIIGLVGILLTNRSTNDKDVTLTPVTQNLHTLEFEVESTKSWQIVAQVEEGDMVTITYKFGEWTNNKNNVDDRSPYVSADGYLPSTRSPFEDFVAGSNLAALMGRVGKESIWEIGEQKIFQVPVSGNLELQINDDQLADNAGSILVEVTIEK